MSLLSSYQVVTVLPKSQVLAVAFIAIDSDVAFTRISVGENESDVGILGQFSSSIGVKVIVGILEIDILSETLFDTFLGLQISNLVSE